MAPEFLWDRFPPSVTHRSYQSLGCFSPAQSLLTSLISMVSPRCHRSVRRPSRHRDQQEPRGSDCGRGIEGDVSLGQVSEGVSPGLLGGQTAPRARFCQPNGCAPDARGRGENTRLEEQPRWSHHPTGFTIIHCWLLKPIRLLHRPNRQVK